MTRDRKPIKRTLEAFEKYHGVDPVHERPVDRADRLGMKAPSRFVARSSFVVWRMGLLTFAAIAVLAALVAVVGPRLLE